MRDKLAVIAMILIFGGSLTGCSILMPKNEDICDKIKRQRIYNKFNNNIEASWLTRPQKECLEEAYKINGCTYK